jgi:hypothetical protein
MMREKHYPPRPHIPAGLLVAGAIVVLVPIIGAGAWLAWQWRTMELLYPAVADLLRFFLLGTLVSPRACTMGRVETLGNAQVH